ncbi:M14 family metallopeptidase [Solwaraspora sp. WMMB335]|uniref:M14 family metallopeptidase n=1 Tax=Solwaraspora sp. WMMB335 TaxID=3404118 RepID=UPI003B9514A6
MPAASSPPRRRHLAAAVAAAAAVSLLTGPATAVTAAAAAAAPTDDQSVTAGPQRLERIAGEDTSVVEVVLADRDALDALVDTGVDLDHHVSQTTAGIVVHAVVTPNEIEGLRAFGFQIGRTLYDADDAVDRIAEREATIAGHVAANQAFTASLARSASTADVRIIRADYYTSGTSQVLSVEAKWAQGQTSTSPLSVSRDSGPGTQIGSGGTQTITRFVDAGVYLYHRGAAAVTARPDRIQIVSPTGDVAIAEVSQWLPVPDDSPEGPGYQKDFVTSYLTPTELYDRIKRLADEYPHLAEVVELPYRTNGYRRKAQVVLGSASANRVAVDSHAWGHEGGNEITVEFADPGAAGQPLTVSVSGPAIRVMLATDGTGAVTSTAAEVAAAIDAAADGLADAYTYRDNIGDGVVAPVGPTALSDNLAAPDTVSRDPHPVYALRIGKYRDGSRTGVLAYAQEHAREWVPPLVAVETAERLLRNHRTDENTQQLLRTLDIWIAPSINPDGGHYSFYDYTSQRKSMTNHCATGGSTDALARNSWGVDNNRNYTEYSLFDGYSGASTSCTSGTFAGPGELSEPENKNLDWLAGHPNIKFSMNLHSSGNYFMWSPGAYATPGRVSAPRPTLAEESFFWGASARILTAIKRHRNMAVTPARTGPISDVLYSAAGNSGDMLWYKYGVYAWNFEVGTSFQPAWEEAHQQTMEYANGLVELMRVARDYDKDRKRPTSSLIVRPGDTDQVVDVEFEVSEPAAVFYTLDGSKPTFGSTLYASAGIREGAETLTVPYGTKVFWFSVDAAGNIEKNYQPDTDAKNWNRGVAIPSGT